MKTQFGNQNLINLPTGIQNGLGVVVAESYRVVSAKDRPVSKHLSSDCPSAAPSLRSLRRDLRDRTQRTTPVTLWTRTWPGTTAVDPAQAASMPAMDMESRLPAAAWAAFVLNHALCG